MHNDNNNDDDDDDDSDDDNMIEHLSLYSIALSSILSLYSITLFFKYRQSEHAKLPTPSTTTTNSNDTVQLILRMMIITDIIYNNIFI